MTSTYYSVQHLWKSLFASVCGALVFRGMRDTGSLGQGFRKTDFGDMDQLLHNGEIYAFALLGCVCGLVGAGFVHATSSLISLVRELRVALAQRRTRRRHVPATSPRHAHAHAHAHAHVRDMHMPASPTRPRSRRHRYVHHSHPLLPPARRQVASRIEALL